MLASGRFRVFPCALFLGGLVAFVRDESRIEFRCRIPGGLDAVVVADAVLCFVRFVRFVTHSLNVGRASKGVEAFSPLVPGCQFCFAGVVPGSAG